MFDTQIIQQVINKLSPHKNAEYTVRDISFLSCSVFGECYFNSLRKIFKINNFSIIFWYMREDKNVIFYRSSQENQNFSKQLAEEFLKEPDYAEKTAKKLIELTDEINSFLKENKTLDQLLKHWSYFIELYSTFFTYHQVVYWTAEYLINNQEKLNNKDLINKLVKIFDAAYKYNENVVPDIEKLIKELGLGDYTYQEINQYKLKEAPKNKNSSLLFLDDQVFILNSSEGEALNKAIQKDYNKSLTNKEITGLIANKGLAKGPVRLILDLAKLDQCQKGDILVTTMTRPQYNSLIKNVAGIITDEGGLLCHASILAREFNIPCLVGTKNATKILKDSDMVEVDANNGVIKKLEK